MALDVLWEDRDVKFDVPVSQMILRKGERVIDKLESVEDTKGNNGERGILVVSNLRIMWYSQASHRINLSIGFSCMLSLNVKSANSAIRGQSEALWIMTRVRGTRYEFIFTSLVPGSPRLFKSVMAVHRAYESSKMYREVRLRTPIVSNKRLSLLPLERLISTISGVWNLSSDQGNLGSFVLTNVRLVWFANMNEGFNISAPLVHIIACRVCDSKFGLALLIETSQQSCGYKLGFRIDPQDRLKEICKEIRSVLRVYSADPIFGVQFEIERNNAPKQSAAEEETPGQQVFVSPDEDVEIDESLEHRDAFAAYLSEPPPSDSSEPVFSSTLGLAIERLKDGFTLSDLWEVFPEPQKETTSSQKQIIVPN